MSSEKLQNPDVVQQLAYAVVRNIPKHFRSKNLRCHFSTFVEEGRFDCFHFKHRPEIKASINNVNAEEQQKVTKSTEDSVEQSTSSSANEKSTFCCFVRLSAENRTKFVKTYSNRHWTDEDGNLDISMLKCFITPVKISDSQDMLNLIEFKPPMSFMPRGNVGTPSDFFKDLIKNCRLPPSVMKNLGLNSSKHGASGSKRRVYSNVPMKYVVDEEAIARAQYGVDPDDGDDLDDDMCQEFERHEALNDDVTSQERTGERLYEEEMEIVWEKGGSGLVFYTDAFHWDQMEGTDTDERWADDWDVDFSIYYGESSGSGTFSNDSRDLLDIRREGMLKNGEISESCFKKPRKLENISKKLKISNFSEKTDHNSNFDAQGTSSVARKVMEKQGWAPGQALGRTFQGSVIPAAVEMASDAQSPLSKKGLGYKGEKLQRFNLTKKVDKRLITTAFDKEAETDPAEKLLRRSESTRNKWRQNNKRSF